jgi:hypothetical protein
MIRSSIAFAAILLTAAIAHSESERVWISTTEDKPPHWAYLGYGVPETDDSFGAFRCKSHSGEVILFIAETGEKLTAGKPVSAMLTAGEAHATVAGRLIPNEEAGVPSFEGRMSADDPIFEVMTSARTLVATIGSAKQAAPLTGAAEKIRKFVADCKKP